MNTVHSKNNRYKNGEYSPSISRAIAQEKAMDIIPSVAQKKLRDDLYSFCLEKGIVRSGFRLYRTKNGMTSNIRALFTILKKNGFYEEFVCSNRQKEND